MTLSLQQQETAKLKFRKWFWIWERDLVDLGNKFPAWRVKANELGFSDDVIDREWQHQDSGRQIKYMENPFYEENSQRS
jgi:hypothetical protein